MCKEFVHKEEKTFITNHVFWMICDLWFKICDEILNVSIFKMNIEILNSKQSEIRAKVCIVIFHNIN